MDKLKIGRWMVCVIISLMMSSCIVYHPHNVPLPLLCEQGEMQIEASVSESAPLLLAPALNASFSYAPVNHLGLQVAASFTDFNNLYAQMAVGTFYPWGKAVFEGYVGYGYGLSYGGKNTDLNNNTYYIDGTYQLPFVQCNFGWRNLLDGGFDVGLGCKAGSLMPQWEKTQLSDDGTENIVEQHTDSHFLIEPQLMLRFGTDHLKFAIHFSYAYLTEWPTENSYFNYERFSLGLGLHYCF